MKAMPQFQTQVRHPLTDHLPELLSAGRLRDPTIGILLLVLIRKNRLKGSAMQIESHHVGRGKSDWRQSREEEFIHHPVSCHPNGSRGSRGLMGCDNDSH